MRLVMLVVFCLCTSQIFAGTATLGKATSIKKPVFVNTVTMGARTLLVKSTPILVPVQNGLDSLPDPLDGSTLPDDLFGGNKDARGKKGSGNGNTAYIPQ